MPEDPPIHPLLDGMRATEPAIRNLIEFLIDGRHPDQYHAFVYEITSIIEKDDIATFSRALVGAAGMAALGIIEAAVQTDTGALDLLSALMLRAEVDDAPGPDRPDDDLGAWVPPEARLR